LLGGCSLDLEGNRCTVGVSDLERLRHLGGKWPGEGKLGGLDFDGHDGGLKRVGEVGRSAW